jgi:hypothetical protein
LTATRSAALLWLNARTGQPAAAALARVYDAVDGMTQRVPFFAAPAAISP